MGGKTKQRTKNNVRPSSSSRSAGLLNSSVNLDGGLVNTSGGKILPALFPSLATVSLDHDLNPEYQMSFKKLNKKDPITRAKALQELCELVNNGNVEDVVAALPSWAIAYKTLTTDTDRRVREMTQMCHGAIVRVCGRRMAPQLKALLPPWLQAQYDEHAPAQAHAQNSLKNTFPDSKLPEVIAFCKTEVMTHLLDNLLGNTEAIINKKLEDPEERSQQMCRISTSSLHGLQYLVAGLPAAQGAWLWVALQPLLDAAAFWKLAQHPAPAVRAAWFGAMGRLCERFGAQLGERCGLRAARLLLPAPRDAAPPVAAHAWTCLLQFMHHVEAWHKYFEKKELIVKRILDILESGGWGDAKHLSTMLLPLLAHLPTELLTKQFYEDFFNAVYKGLDNKNILNSKSERQSWITSLADCLRYLSIQQNDFVLEVSTSVHRTWSEKVLATHHDTQTRNNLIKCSATNMTSLVKYWLKQSKEENSEKYDQLLRNFWQNIGSTIVTQIEKCSTDLEEISSLIDGHILLLQSLKTTFLQGTKKQLCIKFDDEVKNTADSDPVVVQENDTSIVERYKHNLNELAYKVCFHYFETAEKKQVSSTILTPLITLVVEFDSKDLFVSVARQFELSSPYVLYDKVLRPWLAGDTMRCKALVDIVFLMLKHLSDEEQTAILDSFKQFAPSVVEWCVSVCVSHPYVCVPACRRWARGELVGAALPPLARRALQHHDAAAAALLLACLADGPDGEALVSEGATSAVVRLVAGELGAAGEAGAADELGAAGEAGAEAALLAARVLTARVASARALPGDTAPVGALLLRLFTLNMRVPRGGALSLEAWCEVRSAWQDALGALPPAARDTTLRALALLLRDELFRDVEKVDMKNIEDIVSLCPHVFNRSGGEESELPADTSEMVSFTQLAFELGASETLLLKTCALRYEVLTSRLQCLSAEENASARDVIATAADRDLREPSSSELMLFIKKFLFRALYLRTLLLHRLASDDEEGEVKTWCNQLLTVKYFASEYFKVIHDYNVVCSLEEGYQFWPHHNIIEETKQKVELLLKDILAATATELRDKLAACLYRMASEQGYFWCHAYFCYKRHAFSQHAPDETDRDNVDLSHFTDFGYYHILQAKAKWLSDADVTYKTAYSVMVRSWHAARPGALAAPAPLPADLDQLDLDAVVNAYYTDQSSMLYEVDISEAPWQQVVSNVATMEFLALLVQRRGWDAPAHHWDFATITMCSALGSLHKSRHNWASTKVAMFGAAALRLLGAVREFCAHIARESERRRPSDHVAHLRQEWHDIFAPDVTHSVYELVLHVLESREAGGMSAARGVLVCELLAACAHLRWTALSAPRARQLSLHALCTRAAAALAAPAHPALKHLACRLLLPLAPDLVLDDAQKIKLWSDEDGEGDEEKERPQLSMDYFHDAFTHLQEIVVAALNNVTIGEEICDLVPLSDSHTMTLGWLLLAEAMATLCYLARGDLLQFYIQIYRERKYAESLVTAALRLLPGDVFAYAQDNSSSAAPPAAYEPHFLQLAPFSMRSCARGADVALLACRGVFTAVSCAGGGAARGWWGAAAPRAARVLERAVGAYVAPRVLREQFALLGARAHEIADAEVRVAWAAREVECEYRVEDTTLTLTLRLARAHPLVAPRVAVTRGPSYATHWLALFIAYQNGTLLNALKMWTQMVNERVEKSPQCYICYCRLHPNTGRLPKVTCHQCKNKFHNLCLRKWFVTSNKSNCPLCRASF